ncbi:Gfo/Idh/MocA family protein [Propionibacteriaceae bacterium Y2014]
MGCGDRPQHRHRIPARRAGRTQPSGGSAEVITVGLAGASGYGRIHLARLARLGRAGVTELVGVADPAGPGEDTPPGTPVHADLDALLAAGVPDVVIVSTPIHTHVPLAAAAMRAGADVYVEKPPAASLPGFDELLAVQAETGRLCQVGFQSLGSRCFDRIADLLAAGTVGEVQRIAATGLWLRRLAYFQRSAWAGKRRVGDVVVADGVVTNPLSHSVATALRLAGLDRIDRLGTITTELYRANDIEGDDTSFVRVEPAAPGGVEVVAALTVTNTEQLPARVDLVGDRGRISFRYNEDILEVTDESGTTTSEQLDRIDLFENLLAHRVDPGVPLLAPLESTSGFTAVLQAVQDAPPPTPIGGDDVTWLDEGDQTHPVVRDIDRWVAEAVAGNGFAAAGAPWARAEAVRQHQFEAVGS